MSFFCVIALHLNQVKHSIYAILVQNLHANTVVIVLIKKLEDDGWAQEEIEKVYPLEP